MSPTFQLISKLDVKSTKLNQLNQQYDWDRNVRTKLTLNLIKFTKLPLILQFILKLDTKSIDAIESVEYASLIYDNEHFSRITMVG